MMLEAYEEVRKNLLMKKIDEVFRGLECVSSFGGNVLIFRHSKHLNFKLCNNMLISVPYDDISEVKEVEMSGGRGMLVTTKSGYEYCVRI